MLLLGRTSSPYNARGASEEKRTPELLLEVCRCRLDVIGGPRQHAVDKVMKTRDIAETLYADLLLDVSR